MRRPTLALALAVTTLAQASAPMGQYQLATDTVTDTKTQLVWQRVQVTGTFNWNAALAACEGLSLAGQTDWRLPTVKELVTLVDERTSNPSIDTSAFPGTTNTYFWTGTPQVGFAAAFSVNFSSGNISSNALTSAFSVRCVRGG